MALSATTNWVVLAGGSSLNGGGFDPAVAAPGTDFSQQNSPQVTYTDLVIGASNTVTSAAHPFGSTHPGNHLNVTGGTGFTAGWYRIDSVSGSTATLDRSPGTNGSTGGAGRLGGAFASITDLNAPNPTGGTVWVSGAYNVGAVGLAVSVAGSIAVPLTFIGYGTTRGDNQFVTYTANATDPGTMLDFQGGPAIIRNFKVDGANIASNGATLEAANGMFLDCYATRCNLFGLRGLGDFSQIVNCKADACAGTGLQVARFGSIWGTESKGNTTAGVEVSNNNASIWFSIFANNAGRGIWSQGSASLMLVNNTCYGNQDGIQFGDAFSLQATTLINNLIAKNSRYGVSSLTTNYLSAGAGYNQYFPARFWNNGFWGNGTNYFQLGPGSGDILCPVDPTNNPTADDYSLNSLTAGGNLLRGAGKLGAFGPAGAPNGSTGHNDVGAVQGLAAATSTGALFNQAAPVIDEIRFPDQISRGMQGGPTYSTVVVATGGGSEQRVGLWTRPRYRWEINNSPKQPSEMQAIINFFHAREGRLRGFRFKDWSDFTTTNEPLTPTGAATVQLVKTYTSGPSSVVRNIYKPVASPAITLQRNGSPFVAFSVDTTTGIVALTADSTASITAISQATNALVTTSAAHGFTVGQTIAFSGVAGMTAINGLTGAVQTVPTGTTFTVNIATTTFSVYSSGGVASKFIQPGESLSWSGQFDTPVRFDVDELKVSFDDPTSWSLDNVPIVEVRTTT